MKSTVEAHGYAALRARIEEHIAQLPDADAAPPGWPPPGFVGPGPWSGFDADLAAGTSKRLLRLAADALRLAEARENLCSHDHGSPSLRDRFAMAALTGLLAAVGDLDKRDMERGLKRANEQDHARDAYVHADAMLTERKRAR
jgi:hypothetical protein